MVDETKPVRPADPKPDVEVTVAPGWSMRDPGKITIASVAVGGGNKEDRVIDAEHRVVLPGQKLKVFAKDVPALVRAGTILPPKP